MKVATLKDGRRDGRLVVVSRDLARAADATDVAPTLLAAVEGWETAERRLRERFEQLESGAIAGTAFDPRASASVNTRPVMAGRPSVVKKFAVTATVSIDCVKIP